MILLLVVGPYILWTGIASVGFVLARRGESPTPPCKWPAVTIAIPASNGVDDPLLQSVYACDYPTDRMEILLLDRGTSPSGSGNEGIVRTVSIDDPSSALSVSSAAPSHCLDAAQGDVLLTLPAEGAVPPGWIGSMVRRCKKDAPIVVGPTVVEHGDLFLPRLQALQQLGRLAVLGGLSQLRVPVSRNAPNMAVHVETLKRDQEPSGSARPLTFASEADAAVRERPASTFKEMVSRQAQWLQQSAQASSWISQAQAVGLWFVHAVLFACSIVAVGLPAWRQPTLLALIGKMGADVVLSLPAANHYGQRGLLRSIVPSELMRLLAIPIAGVWALVPSHFFPDAGSTSPPDV